MPLILIFILFLMLTYSQQTGKLFNFLFQNFLIYLKKINFSSKSLQSKSMYFILIYNEFNLNLARIN
jgi:hypothetical protein